jgi:arsenate reductase-like glutaredoxin family protein
LEENVISLDKQIHIYSVDTSFFYNQSEREIHDYMLGQYIYRNEIKKLTKKVNIEQFEQIAKENKDINSRLKILKKQMLEILPQNNNIRVLNEQLLTPSRVVSLFESTLTRTLGIPLNTLSKDIIIVQTYFFDVLRDLILDGFMCGGEKYVCFTASAGQIRTKKTMFIKESVLAKYLPTLMCGLSVDIINNNGGININKYLAYLALCNSATDIWSDFNITKSIVVDDMELMVKGEVDYINRDTYDITRVKMKIPIEVTDGCGMVLPRLSKHNIMLRMPWVKGLLVSFPFDEFISEYGCSGKIKDIYGKERDVIGEGIEVIFTKSQFKMWKYYNSWEQYCNNFIRLGCHAGKCNEEEDYFEDAKTNYQMLQTLTDITDEELSKLAHKTNSNISDIGRKRGTMFRILGVTKANKNKNYLQQALEIYPPLLEDTYCREVLKQTKKSIVKDALSGKLEINGKYTFISPDLYAFCQRLFLNHRHPKGLLADGEVFCKIYKNEPKLDCLRSPQLYREHAVRKNVVDADKSKWFTTDALYISSHDLISKLLMNDWDGDKSLVCADSTLITVAERNMGDIIPLYYKMEKAGVFTISDNSIFTGLQLAYSGGNIGPISNDITKMWDSENPPLDAIKLRCMENNYIIDYAKTLYKLERPKCVNKLLSKYTKKKPPHFFMYVKDKLKTEVSPINNNTVNRLKRIIKNPNIHFEFDKTGKFDFTMLMMNKDIELDFAIIDKYTELDLNNRFIPSTNDKESTSDILYKYKNIRNQLLEICPDISYLVDVLVKYLYEQKNSSHKTTLWSSFGDIIIQNLRTNVLMNNIYCESCGDRIVSSNNRHKFCKSCWKEIRKIQNRENFKTWYNKQTSNQLETSKQ